MRLGFARPRFEATSPGKIRRQALQTTPFRAAISVQRAGAASNNHLGACPRARRGVFRGRKRAFEKPIRLKSLSSVAPWTGNGRSAEPASACGNVRGRRPLLLTRGRKDKSATLNAECPEPDLENPHGGDCTKSARRRNAPSLLASAAMVKGVLPNRPW